MMMINLKIELSGLDKAENEVKAVLLLIDELKKTYAPELLEVKEPVKESKKAIKETPSVATPKETAPKEEVTKAKKETKVNTTALTLVNLTQTANDAIARGASRETVKATISKYGTKLSAVLEEDYEALTKDLEAL